MVWAPPIDMVTGLYPSDKKLHRRPCLEPGLDSQQVQALNARFAASAIKDVAKLPEQYIRCEILNRNQIRIVNFDNVRGGMSLMAGPVYEFIVEEIINPSKTPTTRSNLWGVEAKTSTPLGQETWANEGYVIYPELAMTSITSTNPAKGLFTTFDIGISVLTAVPGGGSVFVGYRQSWELVDKKYF